MSTQTMSLSTASRFTIPALRERHDPWFQAMLALTVLTVVCAGLSLVDERTLSGVSVWTKPFKFALSLAVYFGTLLWFAPILPSGYLQSAKGRALTWVPIGCAVFEMAYIILQAGLGQHSHFNVATPFHALMYSLMGGGAVMLVTICLWMGVAILKTHGSRDPFVLAVALGLIVTFVLGGGYGGYLSSQMSHWVGGTASDAQGLTLVKWSRDGGDLRVAHFFGMHAMQLLPMLATLIPTTFSRFKANLLVIGLTTAYATLTTWTFVQAVKGVPFPG